MGTSRRIVGCTNCHEHDSRTARPRNKTLLGPPNFLTNCEHGKCILSHTRSLVKRQRLATHHSFKPPCRTRRIVFVTLQLCKHGYKLPAHLHDHTWRAHDMRSAPHAATHTSVLLQTSLLESNHKTKSENTLDKHKSVWQTRGDTMPLNKCTEKLLRWRACVALVQPTFGKHVFRKLANIKHTAVLTFKTPVAIPHAYRVAQRIIQASVRCQRVRLPTLSATCSWRLPTSSKRAASAGKPSKILSATLTRRTCTMIPTR